MIAFVATRVARRTETLRASLLDLQHEHIRWLVTYFEWEKLDREGENLFPEMTYARKRIAALRGQMVCVNKSIRLWSFLE
jgi:hypothetical protein